MAQLNAILGDGYDREVFERVLGRSRGLTELCERLGRLLPHPEALASDLFYALYKLNVVLRHERELSPAALINREVVRTVLESDELPTLKRTTELDETRAAIATELLGRRVLEALREAFRHDAEALLHAAESARIESELEGKRRELEHLRETELTDESGREALEEEVEDEVAAMESRLRRDRRRQREAAKAVERMESALDATLERLPQSLDEPDARARQMGLGGSGTVDAERRLELGNRIMESAKLRRLARLVGAMREVAFEARRRRAARAPQEMHEIAQSDEIARLLPAEMLGLRRVLPGRVGRALHDDFLRRLTERRLLTYQLHASSERGPMVVCLDGSGSMQGAKELWGKAVALTLMEIARRERRRCLALVFSSGHPQLEVELLARPRGGARARTQDDEVLRFAEHFPGGGTDFEPPLSRALEVVTEGSYRRGDIVFITDGHAPVSDRLRERIEHLRKRHRFKIRAVLVDVADHDRTSVEAFADDVRNVTDLASDTIVEVFAAV